VDAETIYKELVVNTIPNSHIVDGALTPITITISASADRRADDLDCRKRENVSQADRHRIQYVPHRVRLIAAAADSHESLRAQARDHDIWWDVGSDGAGS
jgi:hypothetical protein